MADPHGGREQFVQTLNDKVVALSTSVGYLERDIKDHKVQTEKQFETLNATLNTRFTTIDTKIDKITDAVTGSKINIAKILAWGTPVVIILGALATALFRHWMP